MRSRNPKDVGVKKQKTFKWLYDDVTSKMLEYIGKYEDEKQNNKISVDITVIANNTTTSRRWF
jgi:hypothetical protein